MDVDDARLAAWDREARDAFAQYFDTGNVAGRLAGIVLTLMHEREALLRYINRSQAN